MSRRHFLQSIHVRVFVDEESGINEDDPQTAIVINQACDKLAQNVKKATEELPSGLYVVIDES